MSSRRLVIGVGNRDRGDDAVGPTVCDRLSVLDVPGVASIVMEAGGVDLVAAWHSTDDVVIVDASAPTGHPGRIIEVDALHVAVTSTPTVSTHAVDVGTSIEFARAIKSLPRSLTVIGIEGAQFTFGEPLSGAVDASADQIVDRLSGQARGAPVDR